MRQGRQEQQQRLKAGRNNGRKVAFDTTKHDGVKMVTVGLFLCMMVFGHDQYCSYYRANAFVGLATSAFVTRNRPMGKTGSVARRQTIERGMPSLKRWPPSLAASSKSDKDHPSSRGDGSNKSPKAANHNGSAGPRQQHQKSQDSPTSATTTPTNNPTPGHHTNQQQERKQYDLGIGKNSPLNKSTPSSPLTSAAAAAETIQNVTQNWMTPEPVTKPLNVTQRTRYNLGVGRNAPLPGGASPQFREEVRTKVMLPRGEEGKLLRRAIDEQHFLGRWSRQRAAAAAELKSTRKNGTSKTNRQGHDSRTPPATPVPMAPEENVANGFPERKNDVDDGEEEEEAILKSLDSEEYAGQGSVPFHPPAFQMNDMEPFDAPSTVVVPGRHYPQSSSPPPLIGTNTIGKETSASAVTTSITTKDDISSYKTNKTLSYEDIDLSIPPCVYDPPEIDLVWDLMRQEAQREANREPLLVSFLYSTILNHPSLESSLAFHLANKLSSPAMLATQITYLIREALDRDPVFRRSLRADMLAVRDRDPACTCLPGVFLYFKGFHALQTHRVAHYLWRSGRKVLAHYLQSQVSQNFQIDIHPNATLGSGIMLDHGTGIVIGETAIVGHNCSILHHVTLGGSGKKGVDRHPKVGDGVLLGAGASVLGNVRIGDGCQVGAGTLVIGDLPAHSVAVGVPAKIIGSFVDVSAQPSINMNQLGSPESDESIVTFETEGI